MKRFQILFFPAFFFAQFTFSQDDFTVIKVSGKIVIKRTGSSLDIGTAFAQDEDLSFASPESRAAVINPKRGRFLLTSGNFSEFRTSLSGFLPSAGKISARASTIILNRNDLKTFFEGKFVFFDRNKIQINPDVFPMNDKKYFYLRYSYNNETINKKLGSFSDTLLIDKNELLSVDGKQITSPETGEMELMYMEEGEKKVSTPVCSFTPVFPDSEQLKKEVKVILDLLKGKSNEQIFSEISGYFNEFYGKTDENNLKSWLNENLLLFSPQ